MLYNMRTNFGAGPTDEGEAGTNTSAQEWTRRDKKQQLTLVLPRQGIEPRVFRLEFRPAELPPPPLSVRWLNASTSPEIALP